MAESKEELKSLLMKVKEESEKAGQLNIQKTKIMQTHPNPCEKFREPLIAYLYRELGAES